MHLVPVSNIKEEKMKEQYRLWPEKMKKSNNFILKENAAECNVGQELEDGEYKERTADIWIPPNERNEHLRKANSQDDSYTSKVLSIEDEKTNDFETCLPRETDSEEVNFTLNEQRTELEQQSNDIESQDISVANGILNMSDSQCEMQNPNTLSFGEQKATEEERNSFSHKMTESQDDTDNPETSSSGKEEIYIEQACLFRETLYGNKQDNSNESSEEKPRLFPLDDLGQNSSDTKKENKTDEGRQTKHGIHHNIICDCLTAMDILDNKKLDKVHHALDKKQFETAIDRTINKTQKKHLREKDNKIKDRVNNMPDVSQIKQSLGEDIKQEFGAKHHNEKKTFELRVNLYFVSLFPWMLLFLINPLMATSTDKVCKETIRKVSHCPISTEHQQKALGKCTGVCGDSELIFEYHCVRDSTKTFLVELCAVPFYLFDYCVEYDEVSHIIQMDQFSFCNSSKQPVSLSSNVFLCDPDSCLRIPTRTTNQNTSKTDSTNTTNTYERDKEQSGIMPYIWIIPVIVVTVLLIIITIIVIKITKGTSENNSDENSQMDSSNKDANYSNTSRLIQFFPEKV